MLVSNFFGLSLLSLIFIFGLSIGSFLNVLIYRLPHSLSIFGRSFCPKCKKKISWWDNIPILSFIFLGGRCRFCHSPISWQYPLVELVTGILTVAIFNFHPPAGGSIFNLFITYALIVIFVSDLKYQIVLDAVIFPAIAVSLLISLYPHILISNLLSGLGAGSLFGILFLITRGRGMGLGDVKLAALIGLFLGFPKIIVALYLAFLTGAAIGVILVLIGKKKFGEHIPFGPFLTAATIISLFFGEVIWEKLVAVLL